jgi:hypothetical protein
MKAVVFHGIGDIQLDNLPEPKIQQPTDAIVRLTASAICGTDLHLIRGTVPGMEPGTILGHEGVGIVEAVGKDVRNLRPGDRVVIPSTIACGYCAYCRAGYYAQCDAANPNGTQAGTAFFGGPKSSGPFHGLQAEFARIPFANVGPVNLPADVNVLVRGRADRVAEEQREVMRAQLDDAGQLRERKPTPQVGADVFLHDGELLCRQPARLRPGSRCADGIPTCHIGGHCQRE